MQPYSKSRKHECLRKKVQVGVKLVQCIRGDASDWGFRLRVMLVHHSTTPLLIAWLGIGSGNAMLEQALF
jgi:hypothetical protein